MSSESVIDWMDVSSNMSGRDVGNGWCGMGGVSGVGGRQAGRHAGR